MYHSTAGSSITTQCSTQQNTKESDIVWNSKESITVKNKKYRPQKHKTDQKENIRKKKTVPKIIK